MMPLMTLRMAHITNHQTSKRPFISGSRVVGNHSDVQLQIEQITDARPTYLDLDNGVRISRIIAVSTHSFDAMIKLGKAKSRAEIMHTALIRYKRKCILREHQTLPIVVDEVRQGWIYEHRHGAHVRTNSGTRTSELWALDEESCHEFHVEVGSWLLASIQFQDANRVSALFSRNISRVSGAQVVNLVRPGFVSDVKLIHTPDDGLQWRFTFLEMDRCDELGNNVKRHAGGDGNRRAL